MLSRTVIFASDKHLNPILAQSYPMKNLHLCLVCLIATVTSCTKVISPEEGCPDPEASNYNPEVEFNDGSCEYIFESGPEISIVEPKQVIDWKREPISFEVDFSDDRGLRSINAFVVGEEGNQSASQNFSVFDESILLMDYTASFELEMNAVDFLPDNEILGNYRLRVEAWDTDNNLSVQFFPFTIGDLTDPEPLVGYYEFRINNQRTSFQVNAGYTDLSGISLMSFELWSVTSTGDQLQQLAREDFENQYNVSTILFIPAEPGKFYRLYTTVTDGAGNTVVHESAILEG